MHPINELLPRYEQESIEENDQKNLEALEVIFTTILTGEHIVSSKLFGQALRLLDSRLTLKYTANVQILSKFTTDILHIYLTKRLSIPMKIKGLSVVTKILKYRKFGLDVVIPWETFWDEIFSICTRSSKDQSIACEGLNMKFFEALVFFVHEARHYFPPTAAQEILDEGMTLLDDLRNPLSFFGIEMLVLLLPTTSSLNYDAILPKWVELFSRLTENETWDCCILTLLCRARKYSTSYDWASLLPLLQMKTKELLQLPVTSNGKSHRTNTFPHSFPAYISALKASPMDYRKTAIKKITKLFYFLCYSGEMVLASPCTVTPPIQAKDLSIIGMNESANIFSRTKEFIHFLEINRTYFYPSNTGSWTSDIGYLLLCLTNEMGQHLGQSILKLSPVTPNDSEPTQFQLNSMHKNLQDSVCAPNVHIPTIKYLCGALTSIVLEGLYGKSPFMIQSCNFSLRNLCAIVPSLGNVIVPFLLSALHPDAVNQSHMAPASLTAINHIFKPLIYPEPVILPYMGELLQLSLAGLDPNDPQKTLTTLAMYNSIFSWLPANTIGSGDVRVNGEQAVDLTLPPHYLELIDGHATPASTSEKYAVYFNDLSNVVAGWYPKFIEKLFNILNAKEKPGLTKSSKQPSPMTSYIEESFYEVVSSLDPTLRAHVLSLVLDYASTNQHAYNAMKEVCKMFENLLYLDPTVLPSVLDRIIDQDLTSGDGSTEKITLKIRIIGGCVRRMGGNFILPYLPRIEFLFEDKFKHHTEKSIRKSVAKLIKDLLKGLSSFYVLRTSARCSDPSNPTYHILGRPTHANIAQVDWHQPSFQCVLAAIALLKSHLTNSMNEIESLLSSENMIIVADETKDDATKSVKKTEEQFITNMQIIRRCLRGAAEILGEKSIPVGDPTSEEPSDETDDGDENPEYSTSLLVETGRTAIFNFLSPEDRNYLEMLRFDVVKFLNRVYIRLASLSDPNTTSNLVSLNNNPSIHSVWMKVFGVTVMIRMAVLKNIDQLKKWFSLSKRMIKTSVTNYLEKKYKRLQFCASSPHPNSVDHDSWSTTIHSLNYWIGHDLTFRSLGDRSWIQHVLREKELSFLSIYSEQRRYGKLSAYVVALNHISLNCGHEYDTIRSKAIRIFQEVSGRFGSSLEAILRPLFLLISAQETSYSAASGALSILSLDLVQKRIVGSTMLSSLFLKSIRLFPSMVDCVPEPDKRQKLSDKLSGVFGKFLSNWHHIPLKDWNSDVKAPMTRLLIQFLSDFGVNNTNDNSIVENASPETDKNFTPEESVSLSGGLRHQLYLASSILIFIGHTDIELPLGIWDWSLQTLCTTHGQPIQILSLAALTKLATIEYRKSISHLSSLPRTTHCQNLQNILLGFFQSGPSCLSFLVGLSQTHAHSSTNKTSAQWSKGVDLMLRNSDYIRNVLPRTESTYADVAIFSSHFKVSNASMIMQLLYLISVDEFNFETIRGVITTLLEFSKDIPSTNEEEIRSANTVRAELFSGAARYIRHKEETGAALQLSEPIWRELLNFYNDIIAKVSWDYCQDWAEGIAFGFGGFPNLPTNIFCDSLLSSTAQLFSTSGDVLNLGSAEIDLISQGGFAKDAKILFLVRSLLIADTVAVSRPKVARYVQKDQDVFLKRDSKSQIGVALVSSILQSPSTITNSIFVSPYLAIRQEVSKLLARLVNSDVNSGSFIDLSGYVLQGSIQPNESTDESDNKQQQETWKSSCDIACRWLERLIQTSYLSHYRDLLCPLLKTAIEGCGHYEIEFSKFCHNICLATVQSVKYISSTPRAESSLSNGVDYLTEVINLLSSSFQSNQSLHIRETIIICLSILFANNSCILLESEKKICKEIFSSGLLDPKPEVQVLSVIAMTTYLSIKSIDELNTLAASYVKNSDILAAREKKKRKQQKDTSVGGISVSNTLQIPDPIYLTTIKMSACMILIFPYDLPKYLPSLITSFVRHNSNQLMKDTILKTVQEFKRTHQDRWNEFQLEFTREQLEDLQGAGAAHYFS